MASDNDHTPRASAGPPPSTIMPPRYQFRLKAMRQNSTRVGSPGEMIPDYHLPVDDERRGRCEAFILAVARSAAVATRNPTSS